MLPNENPHRPAETPEAAGARARLEALLDSGSFVELDAWRAADVVTGFGAVEGQPVYAFAQTAGALGSETAARIGKLYALAVKTGAPVVGIYDSTGARLAEGMDLLAAYGELLRSMNNLSGVVPQIAVVTGVCAGTSALLAAAADFLILAEDAKFFLDPPAVAGGAGDAEAAARAGLAHIVAADPVAEARRLVAMLPGNNLAAAPLFEGAAAAAPEALRDAEPNAAETIEAVADAGSLIALGALCAPDGMTLLGTLGGQPTAFVGLSGSICACACRKIARFVRFADAFGLPVVTFVDTEGFAATGEVGAVRDAAALASVYAEATCPQIAVVIGRGFGPAYIAAAGKGANADLVYAWPGAVISPLRPETAVSILYNDKITADKSRADWVAEYAANEASAYAAAKAGLVDAVLDPADTRDALITALDLLASKRETGLPKKHNI